MLIFFKQHIVLENLYGKTSHAISAARTELKVGDNVRISKMKHTFAKGYEGNWSYEIFTIIKVINRIPPVFIIKDFDGKEIEGVFYAKELQKVTKKDDSFWQIEKVLKMRKRNGAKEYFVKWLHHPTFNVIMGEGSESYIISYSTTIGSFPIQPCHNT